MGKNEIRTPKFPGDAPWIKQGALSKEQEKNPTPLDFAEMAHG